MLYIILGSIAAFVLLVFIAGLVFSQGLASKEAKTIGQMESIASRIVPGDEWVEKFSMQPKVDPFCIPSNISCHRLQKSWDTQGNVSLGTLEDQLQIELKENNWRGCHVGEEKGIEVELCVSNDDSPQVNLYIED